MTCSGAKASRRAFLGGVAGLALGMVVTQRSWAQALPVTPVTVPYSPSTRMVSMPVAANDNLAGPQRVIASRTMTKTVVGMKSAGVGLTRTNTALRAIGKVLRVARVGGPWGFLASVAVGYGLEILLDGGLSHLFGNAEGPGNLTVPPGSNNSTAYMSYPYYSSILDIPLGITIARNANTSPSGLVAYYRFDYPSTQTPPSSTGDGWSRSHIQFSVAPDTNRATYTKTITSGQASSGIVIDVPNAPGVLVPGFAGTEAIPNGEADKMHEFLVRKALADDAAANGANAAFPGYQLASPLPFAWPSDVPSDAPQTVGDWKADWPAIPPAEDPQTHPWELPQQDWDAVPTINPSTGQPNNPNPGTSTDPDGGNLPIATGPEVTPDGVGELPGFRAFVDPFENLFNPFKDVFTGSEAACPGVTFPSLSFGSVGTIQGQVISVHCEMIEPFRAVIIGASAAAGGWSAISHILDA